MKFLPQKARTKSNSNADIISDLSEDELESIYSTSLTDVHNSGAVRRSYTNNNSGSTRRKSVELDNNSTHSKSSSKEVPNHTRSESNVNNIETQSTGGSSVSSRIKQFESSKISKIMNKRGFTSKKGKSPSKGGNTSFNDDWRSGKELCDWCLQCRYSIV